MRPHRVDPGGEARLALEDVADPSDEPLVEQRLPELAGRRRGRARPRPRRCRDRGRGCRDRARPAACRGATWVAAEHPQGRAAELGRLALGAGQGHPGRDRPAGPKRSPGGRPARSRSCRDGCGGRARRSRAAGAYHAPRLGPGGGRRVSRHQRARPRPLGARTPSASPTRAASSRRAARRIVSPSATDQRCGRGLDDQAATSCPSSSPCRTGS